MLRLLPMSQGASPRLCLPAIRCSAPMAYARTSDQASLRDLADSRSRILAAADEERRRIERNLHDGAQQRLVSVRIRLGLVEEELERNPARAKELVQALC